MKLLLPYSFVYINVPSFIAGLFPEAVRAPLRGLQQVHLGELHLRAEPAVVPQLLRLRRLQGTILI